MNNSGFISEKEVDDREAAIAVSEGATCTGYVVRRHGRRMFMKRLRPEYASNPRYRAAFAKEFELGYALDHPAVVRYYELVDNGDIVEIYCEMVEGETLTSFMSTHPDYFSKRGNMRRFVDELCDAVQYLHDHGILHLDLKPDNIMITRIGNRIKLIDFGMGFSDMHIDTTGFSPLTSAPEMQTKPSRPSAAADIYSIGAVFDIMLSAGAARLPGIRKLISRSCSADPADRYVKASDIPLALRKTAKMRKAAAPLLLALAAGGGIALWVLTAERHNAYHDAAGEAHDEVPAVEVVDYAGGDSLAQPEYKSEPQPVVAPVLPAENKTEIKVEKETVEEEKAAAPGHLEELEAEVKRRCDSRLSSIISELRAMAVAERPDLARYLELCKETEDAFKYIIGYGSGMDYEYSKMFPDLPLEEVAKTVNLTEWNNGGEEASRLIKTLYDRFDEMDLSSFAGE